MYSNQGRNIGNVDEIENFVKQMIHNRTRDQAVKKWLKSNLRKYLISEYPHTYKVDYADKYSPQWLKEALERGEEVENVAITDEFIRDIEHATPALEEETGNISKVSVPDAIKKGEQRLERIQKKASEKEGNTEVVKEFVDGWKIVSLLDMESLSREGKLMKHCVGDEMQGYIQDVSSGKIKILSLRDSRNIPHATIEYDVKDNAIKQIQGKTNAPIKKEYQKYIKAFLNKPGMKLKKVEDLRNIGLIDIDGKWYDIYNLPEGLEIDGDLDLTYTSIESLPEGLKVGGNLVLFGTSIKSLPEGLTVGKRLDLYHTPIKSLPEGLKVGGNLDLSDTSIKSLPEGLEVGGTIYLRSTPIKSLPEGLKVGGSLNLRYTPIESLPEDLKVGGEIIRN